MLRSCVCAKCCGAQASTCAGILLVGTMLVYRLLATCLHLREFTFDTAVPPLRASATAVEEAKALACRRARPSGRESRNEVRSNSLTAKPRNPLSVADAMQFKNDLRECVRQCTANGVPTVSAAGPWVSSCGYNEQCCEQHANICRARIHGVFVCEKQVSLSWWVEPPYVPARRLRNQLSALDSPCGIRETNTGPACVKLVKYHLSNPLHPGTAGLLGSLLACST